MATQSGIYRPKHDIIESGSEESFRPTISSQAGFYAANRPSTRVSEPMGGGMGADGQIKVPRVIANLEPTDRVSYMTPDAVSGDQNMYVKQYRSEIRLALGGEDDIDIGTASTAYRLKRCTDVSFNSREKDPCLIHVWSLSIICNDDEA